MGGGKPLSRKIINFSQENNIVPMALNMIKANYEKQAVAEVVTSSCLVERGYLVTKLIMLSRRFHFLFGAVCSIFLGFLNRD